MMMGNLLQWEKEKQYYPTIFDTALSFLSAVNALTLERTTHALDGKKIFANVIEESTKPLEVSRFEEHQEYLDIQVLLSGKEKHYFSHSTGKGELLEDRLTSDDVAFYPIPSDAFSVDLAPQQFIVYHPGELHAPLCVVTTPEVVIKVVFKIHHSLFMQSK